MIGVKLKKARENKGLSQGDVANKLNISRQSISKWENDRNTPDIENLIMLSDLYEVSLDELVKGRKVDIKEIKEDSNNHIKKEERNYEWVLLLILAALAAITTPLGLILAPIVLLRNRKNKIYHYVIVVMCLLSICVNIYEIKVVVIDQLKEGYVIYME